MLPAHQNWQLLKGNFKWATPKQYQNITSILKVMQHWRDDYNTLLMKDLVF